MVIFASSKNKLWLRRFAVGQGGGVVSGPRSRCKPHPQQQRQGVGEMLERSANKAKESGLDSVADRT